MFWFRGVLQSSVTQVITPASPPPRPFFFSLIWRGNKILGVELCVWSCRNHNEGWNNGTLSPAMADDSRVHSGVQIALFRNAQERKLCWKQPARMRCSSNCLGTELGRGEELWRVGSCDPFFFLSLKACLQSFELDRAPALLGVYILQAFACTNPSCEH